MTAEVSVIGVPELLARFARAAILGEVASRAAVDVLASEVEATARSLAPVETGALQDSIASRDGVVSAGVPYAPFVEYGTADTPAQPFMRPAADTASGIQATATAKAIMDTA